MNPDELWRENQASRDTSSGGAEPAPPGRYDYLLVVGPGRSGTDFLFDQLRRHPEIAFPDIKEGHYYRSLRRLRRARSRIGGGQTLGDISNQAYRDPKLSDRIRALELAGVKTLVVVVLRDHVARAESMMLFRRSRGEPSTWLGRRFLEKRVVRDRLTASQLAALYDGGADVMAVDFDRLTRRAGETLNALAARCGLESFGDVGQSAPRNVARRARWLPLSALGKLAAVTLRRVGAERSLQRLKESPRVERLFFRDLAADAPRPALSPANARLLREEYANCRAVINQHAGKAGAAPPPGLPVSVVIPCRNAAATIGAALASITSQDYPGPVEVIVADGSDDDSAARVVRSGHPGVRVIPNPERIASTGLNRAVAASSGAVIVRCDAHAELTPGYISRAVATLERTGAATVGGRQVPVADSWFGRAVGLGLTTPLGAGDSRYKTGGPPGPVDTVYLGVFRREALEAVGGFDPVQVRNQDYELNWRLRKSGQTVWFDPSLRALYRPRGNPRQLAGQYFSYGRWKAAMLLRHPASLRPRQLAAPALCAGLVLSALISAGPLPLIGAVVPAAYLLLLAAGSAAVGIRRRDPAALLLPVVLATMHLSWGLGFFLPARRRPSSGPGQPPPIVK